MRRIVFLVLCLSLFSLPLAFAAPSFSMEDVYSSGSVTLEGSCDEAGVLSVPLQVVYGGFSVWVGEAALSDGTFSDRFTPSDEGSYTVYASCAGSASHDFCYGSSCEDTTDDTDDDTNTDDDDADDGDNTDADDSDDGSSSSGGSSGGSGGSGGGSSCRSAWTCSGWSYCNATLEESRVCSDTNNCRFPRNEPELVRSCEACEESWICSSWSACENGVERRSCFDQHSCSTLSDKPAEERSCADAPFGLGAVQGRTNVGGQALTSPRSSFFAQYGWYILLVLLLLLLLIAALVFARKYRDEHRPAANYSQLVDWISREREMGIGDEQIRSTLHSRTGWRENEINQAIGA